jgi:alpha-glucoside transport system substrate-binding protein
MKKLRVLLVGITLIALVAACTSPPTTAATPVPTATTAPAATATTAPAATATTAPAATNTAAPAPTNTAAPTETAAPPAVPDFSTLGFPTVLASEMITASTAMTVTAGPYTIQVPADAFDVDVQFEVLSGDPADFQSKVPSGEQAIMAFAFKVTNMQTNELIGKFNNPVMLTAIGPNIVADSKYYNYAPDGTLTPNPTGLEVTAGQLSHPIAGDVVGWVITSPAGTSVGGLRTPEAAALAAAGGQKIGGSVTVLAEWTGGEQASFMAMITPFENATGIQIQYTGTRDLPAVLTTRVQGGNPPDLSVMPTPGQMRIYATEGKLVDLSTVLDMTEINKWYTAGWLDLGTVDNTLVGVFVKTAIKGLIWYDPKVFDANNYQTPALWSDMIDLSKTIADSGTTPWCVALGSGAATGWPGTDWLEDIVLRQAGATVYNGWWQGTVKWTSPEIKTAWQTWGEIVATPNMVFGGPNAMLATNFGNVGDGLFTTPPHCDMVHQAIFITSFFEANTPGVQPVTDFDFFGFPPFEANQPLATETSGDLMAMFNDTPQSQALIRYLATPEAQAIWAQRGGGYQSANSAVPISLYPDELSRKAAQRLAAAEVSVFDASDNMPNAMQSAFYTAILDYIQTPGNLDSILQQLDSVQQSAYQQQ